MKRKDTVFGKISGMDLVTKIILIGLTLMFIFGALTAAGAGPDRLKGIYILFYSIIFLISSSGFEEKSKLNFYLAALLMICVNAPQTKIIEKTGDLLTGAGTAYGAVSFLWAAGRILINFGCGMIICDIAIKAVLMEKNFKKLGVNPKIAAFVPIILFFIYQAGGAQMSGTAPERLYIFYALLAVGAVLTLRNIKIAAGAVYLSISLFLFFTDFIYGYGAAENILSNFGLLMFAGGILERKWGSLN